MFYDNGISRIDLWALLDIASPSSREFCDVTFCFNLTNKVLNGYHFFTRKKSKIS